jgi:hypothetical protein
MSQLSLFKGRRQRGTVPPPPLEFAAHCLIADMLKRWCNPAWRYTHFPAGEHREGRINPATGKRYSLSGQRLARMGVMPGWPDFIFAGPDRCMFFLELKRRKSGRVSSDQADVLAHLAACGHNILITDSVNDALATLKDLGILPRTVEVM